MNPATCSFKKWLQLLACPEKPAACSRGEGSSSADSSPQAFDPAHGPRGICVAACWVRPKIYFRLCHAESHPAEILAETCNSRSACRHCRYQVGSVAGSCYCIRANTRRIEKPCIASQGGERAGACRRS